jgi:hypothetical protein
MAARDELVAAIAGRYAQGDRGERGRMRRLRIFGQRDKLKADRSKGA